MVSQLLLLSLQEAWKTAAEERRKRYEALDAAEEAIIHAVSLGIL